MKEFGYLNLLKPQIFTPEEEQGAIMNTMTLDYYFGHEKILNEFAILFEKCKPWAGEHLKRMKNLGRRALEKEVELAKPSSLLMTSIMLTGECNANCGICYTDRKKKKGELNWPEIREILEQTKRLGSRTIYIAGEGEPTLDNSLMSLLEYSKRNSIDILMFTNGILFSNERLCRERLGISSDELINAFISAPVYLYHKLWSTNPEKTRQLMGIAEQADYEYTAFPTSEGRVLIPLGLAKLLERMPRERLGVETVVESRTAEEIIERIVPFIDNTRVKSYIEPLIHSGKNFAVHDFDPSPEQVKPLQPHLVRQGCTRIAYRFAVHNNGYATPGISILPAHLKLIEDYEGLNIRNTNGSIKDLFTLRHSHPVLVGSRYKISGCLCEEFNLEMENKLRRIKDGETPANSSTANPLGK